jgi:hypothetical protein
MLLVEAMAVNAVTERPPFDVVGYARDSEERLQSRSATAPPPAEHAALRDSCKEVHAATDEQGAHERPSGKTLLTSAPSLGAVAVPLAAREDFDWFDFGDHGRAIVASIDDRLTVEEILVATGAPIPAGLAVFHELARQGLVAFRPA